MERLGMTRLVIAHRLSTIVQADRIYVLEKGRVRQSGRYGELCAEDGLFKRLVERQIE
jgi:ABC-type multidrug transport system fused ATPase/permease subunit